MYISWYLHMSTQLLLAGTEDDPHHRRLEAALIDVPCYFVAIIFQLLICRSTWPSSSAHHGSLTRHPRCWMHHQIRCTTVASLATTNWAHHRWTTSGCPCRFWQRHRQVLLEQCRQASSGRSLSTSHHGSRPPAISRHGSTRQQLHQRPVGLAKSLP